MRSGWDALTVDSKTQYLPCYRLPLLKNVNPMWNNDPLTACLLISMKQRLCFTLPTPSAMCTVSAEHCDHVRSLSVILVEWTTHAQFRITGNVSLTQVWSLFHQNKRTLLIYRWFICEIRQQNCWDMTHTSWLLKLTRSKKIWLGRSCINHRLKLLGIEYGIFYSLLASNTIGVLIC